MGEESQGNLDSFVDIVANTAGIMIVLVIFSLMSSDKAGSRHNKKKIKLKELTADVVKVVKDIAKADNRVKEVQKDYRDDLRRLEVSLSKFKLSMADIEKLPRMLEKAQAENSAERVALDKMNADRDDAKRQLDAELVEVARKFTDEEIELLKNKNAEDIESVLTNVRSLTDALKRAIETLAARKERLREEIAAAEKESAVLEAQGEEGTLEIGAPTARTVRECRAVWVECFRPTEPRDADGRIRQCVRFVSVQEHAKKNGDALRVETRGESTFQILEKDSAFQSYLADRTDEEKQGLYLMFVVRPDAYRVFRLARKIARDDFGWKVDWRPVAAGTETAFPGAVPVVPLETTDAGLAPDKAGS